MRREIEIRTAFAATRLSAMHLRAAYEAVSPVVERTVAVATGRAVIDDHDRTVVPQRQGGKR